MKLSVEVFENRIHKITFKEFLKPRKRATPSQEEFIPLFIGCYFSLSQNFSSDTEYHKIVSHDFHFH